MGVEIRGLGKFNQQMKSIPNLISKAVESANEELVELVRGDAESNLDSDIKYSSGDLMGSLKHEVVSDGKGSSTGRVWTDKKTGVFLDALFVRNNRVIKLRKIGENLVLYIVCRVWYWYNRVSEITL